VVLAAACSGGGGDGAGGAQSNGGGGERAAAGGGGGKQDGGEKDEGKKDGGHGRAGVPEEFSGGDKAFYRVPDPLPKGKPGDLIRVQTLGDKDGATTVRVMYHSVDGRGRDRAVTGVITYPSDAGAAPKSGWPVISWAHGTTGLATQCAPSRLKGTAPAFGVNGVRVATDYIGLGPIGERHPYLSGPSEAHSVIDGVRAARQLAAAHAGKRWVAVGHSQGGHSALFTNELGRKYAPELDLLGTVAIAPAAVLDRTFGPDDQIVPRMVGIMALYGIAEDHPELDPADYIGPQVAAQAHVVDDGCLNEIVNAFVGIPASTFYKRSPLDDPAAHKVLMENDPGHVKVASPLLVVYGTADTFVVPDRVHHLFDQLCHVGQVTDLLKVPGATHDSVVTLDGAAITKWLDDRLAGKRAPNACPNWAG
jgi:pimeloyl-ACP methyl ester carboxylesterase